MSELPSPDSLPLHDAVAVVGERAKCSTADAQTALRQAGRDGKIAARGVVPLNASADPETAWRRSRGQGRDEDLGPSDWAAEIDWDRDRIGRHFRCVVARAELERWLSPNAVRLYEPDWLLLANAFSRLLVSGAGEAEAKAAICNAMADGTLRFRALFSGADLAGRPVAGRGKWIDREHMEIPSHLAPEDFDWAESRPMQAWRRRDEVTFRAVGLDPADWQCLASHVERMELWREDVDKLRTGPDTPYMARLAKAAHRRAQELRAEKTQISAGDHLPYAEAVKLAGPALFGKHWIGPPSEDDRLALKTGEPHARFVEVHAHDIEREDQFPHVEAWLEKHSLIVEHRGHRFVPRGPLQAALAPHWQDAPLGQLKTRVEAPDPTRFHASKLMWDDGVRLLEARDVTEPADALLHELELGRVRAEAYYQRRDGNYVIGTLEPVWWRHVARFGENGKTWMDESIVWFDNERADPATPLRARDIMLDRDELDHIWPEPILRPDDSASAARTLKRADDAAIHEAITTLYDNAGARGTKPPNVRELPALVKAKLQIRGLDATYDRISDCADAGQHKERRRRPGRTIASERRHRGE